MKRRSRGRYAGNPSTVEIPTPAGGVQLKTFVPWTLVKRGYKKEVITPLDQPQQFLSEAATERQIKAAAEETALIRALGLAHHWQRLIDEERITTIADIAEAEEVDVTQIRRLLRLTLLAPAQIETFASSTNIKLETVTRRNWSPLWFDQYRLG
jgi:hypothetical protein